MMSGLVGDVKGVVVLDNEGKRIIAKYYNSPRGLDNNTNQKYFERQLFLKSNKQGGTSKMNMYENDIMTIDNYTAIFRCYVDMTIYILGDKDDNELALAMVLDTVHDCFDNVFKKNIERKSLINNMTAVILVIDELIDQGIVMTVDSATILKRINIKGSSHSQSAAAHDSGDHTSSTASQGSSNSGGGMFASVFASAKSSLAKSLAF